MSELVKLSAKLAADDDLNGLDSLVEELLENPEQIQPALRDRPRARQHHPRRRD